MINVVLKPKKEIQVSLKPEQGIQIEATKKYLFDPAIVQEYVDASAENAELSQQIYDQFVAESDEFKEEVKVISRETAKDEVSGVVAEVEANVEIAKEASQSAAESAEKAEYNAAKVPDPSEENTALIYKDGVVQWGKAAAENDGVSITENAKGQIQTIGVIDNNGEATKIWNGTRGEFDALEEKDSDTLYNVVDDETDDVAVSSFEIGDIGIAPLGIDETQNKRRYLNGQVILQSQFVSFTAKVKNAILQFPNLGATEENWQAEVTNSKLGQCGKFVVDDALGTIRLPKVVNVQGLADLSLMGSIKAESLPNITGTYGWGDRQTASYQMSGALYDAGTFSNYKSGGGSSSTVPYMGFDASRSSQAYQDNAPVQQEAIQYPYFIQVATGVEESVDVTREIELNNPFFFGMSQYFESAPNNASWLLSNGEFHSGSVYVSFYQWLLRIYNGVDTVNGVSVKLHTEEYGDYDYVLNTDETSFRLPIYDGSENIPSDKYEDLTVSIDNVTAHHNGIVSLVASISTVGSRVALRSESSGRVVSIRPATIDATVAVELPVSKGDTFQILPSGDDISRIIVGHYRFYENKGNGSLYFYVGEAVQDANLISIGKVTELLARLENYDYVVESKMATESDPIWYRVYKSGWVEQGGDMGTNETVNLPKKMLNSNYYVDVTWNGGKQQNFYAYDGQIKNRTTTSFYTTFATDGANVKGLCWIVKGQGAK